MDTVHLILRLIVSATVAAALLSPPIRAADTSQDTPQNVLILLADDLGVDMLASYGLGADLPPTPNLDALAADGEVFLNAWSNPTCSPTRAAIQTGRAALRTGIGAVLSPVSPSLPLSEITLPEMLDIGTGGAWAHGAFGKWHLADTALDVDTGLPIDPDSGGLLNPNLAGWSWFSGSMYSLECPLPLCNPAWWQAPLPYDYYTWPWVQNGTEIVVDKYATTQTVDQTIRWLKDAPEPWLAYVAFHAPHSPYQAPPTELNSSGLEPGTIATTGPERRLTYKAMIEALDTEIGRLFGEIDGIDPTLLDRTTVVFLGDNGTPAEVTVAPFVPSHAKGTLFEGGVHVPLIVCGPQVAAPGSTSRALVSATDLFATVADVAGVDIDATFPDVTFDSISLLPYLADPDLPSLREALYSEHFKPIVTGPVCQTDLGFGGPGDVQLSVCGDILFTGNSADFTLKGAPPAAMAFIVGSQTAGPVPLFGGQLGPFPIELILGPLVTGLHGAITFPIPGGSPICQPFDYHFQVIVQDRAQPSGWSLSNTVKVSWPDDNERYQAVAARNRAFELIRVVEANSFTSLAYGPGVSELFYDVRTDPFEQDELLSQGLTPGQAGVYAELSAFLDAMLASR